MFIDEAAVDAVQLGQPRRIDHQPIGAVEELIAGRAGQHPLFRQRFLAAEDLLHEHVERMRGAVSKSQLNSPRQERRLDIGPRRWSTCRVARGTLVFRGTLIFGLAQRQHVFPLQTPQIDHGIVKPVDMIDAQAVDRSAHQQLEHQAMALREDGRIFHAHGRQFIDVEKTVGS